MAEGSVVGGGSLLLAKERFPSVDISLRSYAEIESSISDLKKELKSFDKDIEAKIKEIKESDPKLKDPQNKELVKQLQTEKHNAEKIVRIQESQIRSLEGKTPLIVGERPKIEKPGITNMVTFDQSRSQKEIHDSIRRFVREGELSDNVKSKIEKEKQSTPEYKKLKDLLDQKQKLEQNFLKDNLDRIQGVQNNTFDANGDFQQLISSDPQKFKDFTKSIKEIQTKIDSLSGPIKAIDKEFEVRTKIEKYKEMGIGIEYDKKDPNLNYKLKQLERAFGVENSRQDQIAALENLQNKGVSFANPIFETIVTPTNGISLQPAIGQGNLSIYTNASGMEIRRPIPLTQNDVVTSSPDTDRLNPGHGKIGPHTGTDYGIPTGTKLGSVMEGKVIKVEDSPDAFLNTKDGGPHNGASVTIESTGNEPKIRTTYYHLSHVNVSKDETVKMGDLIGKSGNSGNSVGPHLHFIVQVKVGNDWVIQKNEEFDWKDVP